MNKFYSPNGNIEVWEEKPEGYYTELEWENKHPELFPPDNMYYWDDNTETWVYDVVKKRNELKSICHENMKVQRDSGFIVDGVTFDSDDSADRQYLKLPYKFNEDPDYTITNWKASGDTYVTMDKSLFDLLAVQMEVHTGLCYVWECSKFAEIDAAETQEQLELIQVTYGD